MSLSRRTFLRTTTAAFAVAPFSASILEAAAPGADRAITFIPHAEQYGAFWAMVEDGKFVKAIPRTEYDPRPTKMVSHGAVSRVYSPTRILHPYVRKSYLEGLDGDRKPELRAHDEFVRVDWDTAIGLTAKAILDTIDEHGNEAIFSSSYGGWSHGGVLTANVLQGRLFNLIGGSSVTVADYSGGAAQVLMPHVVGDMEVYSRQTSWFQILQHCEQFVLIGTDPHKNGRAEGRVTDHSMYPNWELIRDAGVKFISINPQRTTSDDWLNAEWIKIIPNTDTALFMAMTQHLLVNDLHDKDFLGKYTVGWEAYADYLMGKEDGVEKTPDWAAAITGIEAAQIREMAESFNAKRTQMAGSWAIQRAHHGEMPYWAITAFTCFTGQFGLPGGGVGFSWHWGQGGALFAQAVTPGGLPQGRNRVTGICPASRINEMLLNPGKEFVRNGQNLVYPDVHMLYNAGNNFASHQQDTNELLRAMQKLHTVVCQDCWWTAAAQVADIVLPACTTLEKNEISSGGTYSKDKVYAMRQVIEPLGESLDDYEIFRRLAEVLGVESGFTEGLEPMDIYQASYEKTTAGKDVPFEKFWEDGVVRVDTPVEERTWTRHGAFREDPEANPLHTKSGKVEIYCQSIADMNIPDCPPMPTWLEPAEYLNNAPSDDMLHIVSPHPYNRIHSQFAQSDLRHELNIEDREFVRISVEDAEARGIADGDLVEIWNDRGALIAGARVDDGIMKGVVSLYEGAWLSFDTKGRCNSGGINILTSSRASSGLSQATTANTCLVKMKKATDVEGPNMAYQAHQRLIDEVASVDLDSLGLDRAYNLAESAFADMEPGEKIFYERCTLCHIPRDPKAHTKHEWQGITESMFPNAGLEGEEAQTVLDWLFANARDA